MDSNAEIRAAAACRAPTGSFEVREGLFEIAGGLDLHHGGRLEPVRIAWRIAGARGAPVIAALGGISAHRRVFGSTDQAAGWWDELAGPDRALDSSRFRILGMDFLGGSAESTGPRAGDAFPSISTFDQASVLVRLLDHLNIDCLRAIAGASYGGMVALAFAQRYPARVQRLVVISAADVAHPMATAWRSVQRRMVRFALEQGRGADGLELARALAMATYRSPGEFATRFRTAPGQDPTGRPLFAVEQYLFARGAEYATQYRPEAFLCLSESIDLHQVDAAAIRTPTTLIAVQEDQLVPPADLRALAARLAPRSQLRELNSLYGHDAFLKERAQLEPLFAEALASNHHE